MHGNVCILTESRSLTVFSGRTFRKCGHTFPIWTSGSADPAQKLLPHQHSRSPYTSWKFYFSVWYLLSPAQRKITEAEYWLQKRGQKELEDINEQIIADVWVFFQPELICNQTCFPNLRPIHAIRDKVRFSSISFLKIVLHSFAQNNDLVRIFRSIFFALVDKLRTKSWLPFLALPINANVISWATSPFWNSIHAVQFIHELLHGRYDLTDPLPRTPAHRR